mgnify:FL=1
MGDPPATTDELLTAVLRAFPDIGFVIAEDGTYVEVLAGPETETLGYEDPETLEGERISDLLPAETATRFMGVIEDAIRTGDLQTIRYPLEVVEGRRWFEARIAPMETSTDREHVVWISRDITGLRNELETQARTADAVIQTIDDVFYLVDPSGTLHRWNDRLTAVTGHTDAEIADMHVASLFADTDAADVEAYLESVFETGAATTQVMVETTAGERIPFSFRTHAFDHPALGKVACGIGRDISAQWAHERTLQQRGHQLRLLNRLLRHDVRNDLTTIRGGIERLRSESDGHDDVLARLERATEHIVELTETAGRLADRIDAEDSPQLIPVDLQPVVEMAIDEVRERYPRATIDCRDNPPIAVRADSLLDALVTNLLDNAVRHNDRTEPTVTVSVEEHAETVAIEVADDGPGLSDTQKRRLFESDATSGQAPETGMGLYLVDLLVDRYGGSITIEDNEPTGAVFGVELPLA